MRSIAGLIYCWYISIIVDIKRHVVLIGMVTCGANRRGSGAFMNVTADQTLPLDRFFTLPNGAVLHLINITFETAAVMEFDGCNSREV